MDPVTIYFGATMLKSGLTFISNRKANKQYLQQLHTNKLVNRNQALIDINLREEDRLITQANNEVWASAAGYDPFDSGSFKAIATNVNNKADEDVARINLGMKIKDDEINSSLKNLNSQMRLNEIQLIADIGLTAGSYNMYLKDQRYLEMQRKIEIKKAQLAQNKTRFGGYSYRTGKFNASRRTPYKPYKGKSFANENLLAYRRLQPYELGWGN